MGKYEDFERKLLKALEQQLKIYGLKFDIEKLILYARHALQDTASPEEVENFLDRLTLVWHAHLVRNSAPQIIAAGLPTLDEFNFD